LPPSLDAVIDEPFQRKGRQDMTAPPLIKLRLLGRFSATADGEPPLQLKISSKKGIALLAYLALHPEHSVSREKLATLLWGDRQDRQARLSLRQVILSLRKTFAESELIALDGDVVGLRMDRVRVDALEFQKLTRSTDLADLDRAAALYVGPFLNELESGSEDFAAWLETVRSRFEAEAARVLESCADRRDLLDQGDLAVDASERLVALDPLREDWQRRLLRVSARHRGGEVALVHAKKLVALLKKELDVEPESSTSELIEEIRRGAIEPARQAQAVALLAEGCGEPVAPAALLSDAMTNGRSTAGDFFAPSDVVAPQRHWPESLWRAGIGALWFAGPVGVLFAGALLLGNPQLTPVRRMLSSNDVVGTVSARLEPAPVVVLPFEADDKQDDAIAKLVSDNVIDQLSRVPNLRVISRLTSHQFWQASDDIVEVGNRLNVRYAVHGRVKAERDKWRVNVELIDIASRLQIWSDQFDQGSPDRPEDAGMIASLLGRAVQVAVIRQQADRANSLPSAKPGIDTPR
jgi:DNA-binding SARP family transcriptional activator/TolB-like protein